MSLIYIVMWRYSDNSGFGPVSAHQTEAGAHQMLSILSNHCDTKIFYTVAVPSDVQDPQEGNHG